MVEAGLNYIFQPHGLGHFMGLDVHDVGGYLNYHPGRPQAPGVNRLRTARTLRAGMVLTVEPGCYFVKPVSMYISAFNNSFFDIGLCFQLLDKAFSDPKMSKFLIPEAIERFKNFGGVRIEDDIIVTENGCEDMTIVPRT